MPRLTMDVTLSCGTEFHSQTKEGAEEEVAAVKELLSDMSKLTYLSVELDDQTTVYFNPQHIAAVTLREG